jgi:phosphoribosylanthranilate isomerase
MLVQIYETSSAEEAHALADLGVDHIGVLVGDGSFPREQSVDQARLIFSVIPSSSKGAALLLSADVRFIEHKITELKPSILHLGASTDLLTCSVVQRLKERYGTITIMRSILVIDDESVAIARSYDEVADMLLFRQSSTRRRANRRARRNPQLGDRQENHREHAYSRNRRWGSGA